MAAFALLTGPAASADTPYIYTVAGNGFLGYAGDGGPATSGNLNDPYEGILDSAGNLYIADSRNNVIRKVAAGTGVITTIAGTGIAGYSGDNGAAAAAQISGPTGMYVDSAGNVYFSETASQRVRMITAATGAITTVAGTGLPGYSGDGGPAVSAQLDNPQGLAVDNAGNLYIADGSNGRIRVVDAKSGVVTTLAGNGSLGYAGDGGPATAAALANPNGVAVDSSGNVYIADSLNNLIRKVTVGSGVISTVAGVYIAGSRGAGTGGYSGDGGPATSAELNYPLTVAVDAAGNLYIADSENQAIRKVTSSNGIITTIAGNGSSNLCQSQQGDGGPATSASLCFPQAVSVDTAGNLYIADSGHARMRVVSTAAPIPTTAAAEPVVSVPAGTYSGPQMVTITDTTPGAAIYVTTDGTQPSTAAYLYNGAINVSGSVTVQAVAVAPGYLTSSPLSAAYTITSPPARVIKTIAGSGVSGFTGAGGPAINAQFGEVPHIAVDTAGNLFFTDQLNSVVWSVAAATGTLSIVAGSRTPGYSGDGGPATSAELKGPSGIAVDSAGNLYIADSYNNVVRKVTASTGFIQTFAGTYGRIGFGGNLGNGNPATDAYLNAPSDLALDAAGNLYIADSGDNEVRVVSSSTGIITSVAGTGGLGYSGEGGAATNATLQDPESLALDGSGNVYIGSYYLGRVCKVTKATGILTTVAGNGDAYGTSGDGGLATAAEVNPRGLALDSAGNLYIANALGSIREVAANTGVITKVVGNGVPGYFGDGGSVTVAEVQLPAGMVLDASGNLYFADSGNYVIREVSTAPPAIAPNVTVTLSATSITTAQALTVTVAVSGPQGSAEPAGSTSLSGGGYTSQQTLANGNATFSIAAGALAVGRDTLTATYTPDATSAAAYTRATQPAVVVVTPVNAVPLAIAVTKPSPVAPGGSTTASVTLAAGSTYSGTVHLACALTASPAGARNLPVCALQPSSVTIVAGGNAAATLTVNTTGPSSAKGHVWNSWSGRELLAMSLVFCVPSWRRRRVWLMVFLCGAIGCGGAGGTGSTPAPTIPATTAGTYSFSVSGTDAGNTQIAASATLTITVE